MKEKALGPSVVMKVGVAKETRQGGWKDLNTHQEAVLPNERGM